MRQRTVLGDSQMISVVLAEKRDKNCRLLHFLLKYALNWYIIEEGTAGGRQYREERGTTI